MDEATWLTSTEPQVMLAHLGDKASARRLRLFATACCRAVWDQLTDEAPCGRCGGVVPKHCRDGFCSTTYRMGGCECDCDGCMGAMAGPCPDCGGTGRIFPSRRAVEVAERFADGLATEDVLGQAGMTMLQGYLLDPNPHDGAIGASHLCRHLGPESTAPGEVGRRAATQAALLRDIFNPFRPVRFDKTPLPPGLFRLARQLAQTVYEERRWGDLPILADALEEAGCTDEAILSHLRGTDAVKVCPSCVDYAPDPETNVVECGRCECTGIVSDEDYEPLHVRGCWVLDAILVKE